MKFYPGHTACAGCGAAIAVKLILEEVPNPVIVNATGCLEIFTSLYGRNAWGVPYVHVDFENAAPVAGGVSRVFKQKGVDAQVLVFGGDGATYDIGFGNLSGAAERNEDILYICYDNEAYMNTGVQRSGSTPLFAKTTTSEVGSKIKGKQEPKKPIADIILAHKVPYVATASMAYPYDLKAKVKKALSMKGFRFICVYSSCPTGWGHDPSMSVEVAKRAVESGLWVLWESENGKKKVTYKPSKRIPVKEYLSLQKRFKHLTEKEIGVIQAHVDGVWKEIENKEGLWI